MSNIYKYDVKYDPECPSRRLRLGLIKQHKSRIGANLFDGAQMLTIRKLHDDNDEKPSFELTSETNFEPKQTYKILCKFTKIVSFQQLYEKDDPEILQVLNLILRGVQRGLDLKLVGRNYYDTNENAIVSIPFYQRNFFFNLNFTIFCCFRSSSHNFAYNYGLATLHRFEITMAINYY